MQCNLCFVLTLSDFTIELDHNIYLLIFLQNHNSTALVCQCNPFGSTNKSCDEIDGKCICKTGYEGMNCDKCASVLDIDEPNHESQCSGKNYHDT